MASSSSSGGVWFGGMLFIAFLVMKLCGVINWSWWWITAPLWIGAVVLVVIALIAPAILIAGSK